MLLEIILGILAFLTLIYWYMSRNWKYWTKRGVYQIEPTFPFGSLSVLFTKSEHLADTFGREADETKGLPFYGIYFLNDPILMVRDADLVRQITIKDFDHFVDRTPALFQIIKNSTLKADKIWMEQMTSAEGDQWKSIRSTFTPIFTSGKMKAMLIFMQETCNHLIEAMDANAEQKTDFELKEILGKYSMDTIASCAFGVDAQAFTNEKSTFVEYAANIFQQRAQDMVKLAALFMPFNLGWKVLQTFEIPVFKKKEIEFFYSVVLDSIKQRRESKSRRNDLIDLMVDAIKGQVKNDENEESDQFDKDAKLNHVTKKKEEFDELIVVATAIVILVAGYDTTGSTLAFACYQLAKNPDIQEKLREEVNGIVDNDPSKELTYDDLQSMNYVDQIISETLRFYNPAVMIQRVCTKEYKVPGHDLLIEKGKNVWFNLLAIHHDPKHYENPHDFDPEHFSKEAVAKRHPYAFLPFGRGPRGCIGMRFALLEAKLALANIVRRYNLTASDKTKEPLEYDPYAGITYVKSGLFVKVEKRI